MIVAISICITIFIRHDQFYDYDTAGNHSLINYQPDSNSTKYSQGQNLFEANCTSCHAMNKTIIAPPLENIQDKEPDSSFFESIVLRPEKLLKKDNYAKALYRQYHEIRHPNFSVILTKGDVKKIFGYCKNYKPQPLYDSVVAGHS